MLYYSEILNKKFATEEECLEAENKYFYEMELEKKKEEEKDKDIDTLLKIRKEKDDAIARYNEQLCIFRDKYGSLPSCAFQNQLDILHFLMKD